jgi:hypothetical protein
MMKERGIPSAAELARMTGIPDSTVRTYLSGSRNPPLEACREIGLALGVNGDWIYYGRGTKEGPQSSVRVASPSDLLFAAVEEAGLVQGLDPLLAREVAEVVQLALSAPLRTPPGTTAERAVRSYVRFELRDRFPHRLRQTPTD